MSLWEFKRRDAESAEEFVDYSYAMMLDGTFGVVTAIIAMLFVRSFCKFQEDVFEEKDPRSEFLVRDVT